MHHPLKLARMGQMAFQAPQMGPSMSPAFIFQTQAQPQDQAIPTMPAAPGTAPTTPVKPPAAAPPAYSPSTTSYGNVLGPALVVLAVGIIVGLSA